MESTEGKVEYSEGTFNSAGFGSVSIFLAAPAPIPPRAVAEGVQRWNRGGNCLQTMQMDGVSGIGRGG